MKPRKRYAPRLADDGLPAEMHQDVLRACHRWLIEHDTDYRHERLSIEAWMQIHRIPNGQLDPTSPSDDQ